MLAILSMLFAAQTAAVAGDQSYLDDAREYLQKGDVNAAVIQLKNALQEKPSDVEARLLLGQIYLRAGNAESAEKELTRAARLNASRDRWQVDLAKAYLMQRKFSELLTEIEPDPTLSGEIQAEIYTLRGQAYRGTDETEQARSAFEKALSIVPDSSAALIGMAQIALAGGDQELALEQVEKVLAANPDHFDARLLRGELYKRARRFDDAIADFSRAVAVKPRDPRGLLGRAVVNLQKGAYPEAAQDLGVLNELAPENPIVLYLNGVSAFQQRDLETAEQFISKVLNLQPNHVQSQLIFGSIRFSNGDYVQADEYLSRVHAVLPNHLPTIKLLAAARIRQNKHEQAVQLLEPAAKAFPDDAQLKAMLGNSLLKLGRFEEGSEALGQAVELMPDIASLRTQHAFGLLAQGDTSSAIGELQSAVELDQDLIQADVLLVLSHLRNKENAKALAASQALEERQPDNPVAHNLTGLAYLAAGQSAEARAKFEHALELEPKFVTAEINLARIELSEGRLQEAKALFASVLQKDANNLTALLGMAGIEERDKNRSEMYRWLERARDSNPRSSKAGVLIAQSYLRDGEHLKALRAAREMISNFPEDPAVLSVLSNAQIAAGEINSAVQSLKQLAEIQPAPQTLVRLAAAQRRAGDTAGARSSLEAALQIDGRYLPALSTLADIALKEARFDEATSLAKRIQEHFGDRSIGFEIEGVALLRQEKLAEALALFEQAYRVQPSAKLAMQLSTVYRAQNQSERSIAQLSDWLEKRPDDARVRAVYASLLQGAGSNSEAVTQYERVLESEPGHIVALNNLAWLYQTQGDPRAVEIGARAYQLAPDKPEIADTYGWVLVNFGRQQEGLEILQEAMSKMPDNPEVAYHVAVALSQLNRPEDAKRILARVVRDHPDAAVAPEARALLDRL